MTAHDFSFEALEGGPLPLSRFEGQVVLVVNTASHCGLTPQYAGLGALHRRFRDRGFSVLGVPSNDFGQQEPGSAEEIREFCTTRFAIDFPLAAKVAVTGATAHPFYRWAAEQLGEAAVPRWNFHKYLIGKDGSIAGVFGSRSVPEAPEIVAAIEAALAD